MGKARYRPEQVISVHREAEVADLMLGKQILSDAHMENLKLSRSSHCQPRRGPCLANRDDTD
jgi:hypothetical protein